MSHKIKGTVSFFPLGPGFWGITDDSGRQWRPVKMPKKLQKEGLRGVFEVREVEEEISIFMWGTPVRVLRSEVESS